MKKILAIGAHPDDIEFGAGGTIASHSRKGHKVFFLVLTAGEAGGQADIRKKEALESSKKLGVSKLIFLDFRDTKIEYNYETIKAIEDIIDEIKPDRIYTHCEKDKHQDHRNTALASITASRNSKQVLSYESPSTYPTFHPQFFVKLSDEIMELKISALECYKSQSKKEYMKIEAFKGLARFRGLQSGNKYAEAFEVIRYVEE